MPGQQENTNTYKKSNKCTYQSYKFNKRKSTPYKNSQQKQKEERNLTAGSLKKNIKTKKRKTDKSRDCLLYTSPSPRD